MKQEDITNGSINPLTITEGVFDLDLNDAVTATDVNGDGIPILSFIFWPVIQPMPVLA